MANIAISNLPMATALTGAELVEIVQASTSMRTTASAISALGGGVPFVYPPAGIPNSTGSAWGASYSTTGSGAVALANAPSLTNPSFSTITNTGTLTLPTTTDTLVGRATTDTLTNKTLGSGTTWNGALIAGTYGGTGVNNGASTITVGGNVAFSGAFSATLTLTATTNSTLPAGTHTLAGLDVAQSWTAAQTFSNSDIVMLGSSTGATTFASANAGASNFTLTFPAITDTLVSLTATQTLTSKQVTPRVVTVASTSTPTPVSSTTDMFVLLALAVAATFASPGAGVDGQQLTIRIKDNGTARGLSWNAIYRAVGVTLPTTTVLGKVLYVRSIYNAQDSTWDVILTAQQ